jgi:hypothetical protein
MSESDLSRGIGSFFKLAFGQEATGFICIAILGRTGNQRKLTEYYFQYPNELPAIVATVERLRLEGDVYFCPQLLERRKRNKDSVKYCTSAWADLDACEPEQLIVEPTIIVESSPGRYQALWRFAEPQAPYDAEDVSMRIAYRHADEGADKSGYDLSQLLRIPGTPNYKYPGEPIVPLAEVNRAMYTLDDFEVYPEVRHSEHLKLPMPDKENLPTGDALDILQSYRHSLNPLAFQLYSVRPEEEWSSNLWKLEMLCFEAGMAREEVFYVASHSACNKYRRDGKDPAHLWSEVCRAFVKHHENINAVVFPGTPMRALLSDEERKVLEDQKGFVERYIEWASGLGDAAPQYHQAGAFTILSALLSGRVVLPTSFGTIKPNLWFMILGDTTLTRKSTAMELAIDLVMEVDPDCVMATDGSVEGLMQQLEARPRRPSIFLRDEFSGLLEMMVKRDYYAGMAEVLTKLYDGKMQKRVLRKETVTVRDPVLIILAGGIRTRVTGLLTHEHVSSGFIPRFVFVTAESDTDRLQPLGPPTTRVQGNRLELIEEMEDLYEHYSGAPAGRPKDALWEAQLSPEAWQRYNQLERTLVESGLDSEQPDLMTPLYDRLAKSTLKAAVLVAAARQRTGTVLVEPADIIHAIKYAERWREYAIEIVNGIGKSVWERDLDRIARAIAKRPGVSRSQLMQSYHLNAKQADLVFETLIQRNRITATRNGGRQIYFPMERVGGNKK